MTQFMGKLCLGVAACAFALGATSTSQAEEINVLTANEGTCSVYGPHIADQLGIYDDAGIEENLLASETTIPYVAFLSTGDAEIVMLDSAQVYQMARSGQDAQVIYEVMQKAPEGLVVAADGDVASIADLSGKVIGMASDRDQITTIITLDAAGVSIDDVQTVVVGDQAPLIASSFNDGSIQAFAGGSQDFAFLEAAGVPTRNLTPAAVSQNVGNSFAISGERKEEVREITTGFLRGWAMAQLATLVDTKAAASMCRAALPEEWENLDTGWSIANIAFFDLNLPRTKLIGELQPDVWASVQEPYIKLGELDAFIEPSTFLDDSFTGPVNDFTTAEVKERINAWREANADAMLP